MNIIRHTVFSLLLITAFGAVPLRAQVVPPANSAVSAVGAIQAPVIHPLQISCGDLIDVEVFDTPDLSGKLRVDDRGAIALPLAGALPVVGLTAEEASRRIEERLHETDILKDPHVSVAVLEYATQGITIMGEVRNPGVYPLLGARGLLDLISEAGGLTGQAGGAATVTHRADLDHPVTVKVGSNPGASSGTNLDIRPGDTIVVSHAGIVYVVGDVVKPGGFVIENSDQLTVLQAVALAQGTNRTASLDRARVIRKADAGKQELPISLRKILANSAPDEMLYDGDILIVPSSAAKNALRGVEQVLPAIAGAAIYRVP